MTDRRTDHEQRLLRDKVALKVAEICAQEPMDVEGFERMKSLPNFTIYDEYDSEPTDGRYDD